MLDQLVGVFEAAGPDRPVDIDNAAQRESLDVIGRVGEWLSTAGAWSPRLSLLLRCTCLHQVSYRTRTLVPVSFVGFDTDFQAVTSMTSKSGANRALDALHGGEVGHYAL